MQGKGIMNNFTYLYDAHKFDKRTMEQYLEDVQAEDVILNAFDFTGAGNTIFGFKYWKEIDAKWQQKLGEYRQAGTDDIPEAQIYCPHCARLLPRSAFALKSNGTLHKHCRECEGGIWDKQKKEREKEEREREKREAAVRQLEKEIAEKQAKVDNIKAGKEDAIVPEGRIIENGRYETVRQQIAEGQSNLGRITKVCTCCGSRKMKTEFPANPTTEDGLDAWCKTCQKKAEKTVKKIDARQEQEEPLQQEETVIVPDVTPAAMPTPVSATIAKPDRLVAPKLGEHDATLHYKKGQKSITFNAQLSALIQQGQFTKCYLNSDRSHRMFLIFNRLEGANVTSASSRASMLVQVCSSEMVRSLAARFGLDEGDNYYLHITKNLAPKADVITIEIMKARTLQEYIRIVEQREEAEQKGRPVPGEDVSEYEGESEAETPAGERPQNDVPLIDFGLDFGDGQSAPPPADEIIQMLIDRRLVTEHDMAVFLFQQGWELHEPVVVTKLKKFTV